ncbi:MAG TPA: hypothetical protein VHN12_04815 [Geobacteraceae bacterium]|nr:hypothetical protein [Geobacteraceae bacterium]
MLTELVKAIEEKKQTLEKELAAIHDKNTTGQTVEEQLTRETREKERCLALINEQAIKEYMALWQSFTPPSSFPCPFCYLFQKKTSPLRPLPRMEDVEPVRCTVCGETFEIPVELLYA